MKIHLFFLINYFLYYYCMLYNLFLKYTQNLILFELALSKYICLQ